jgi:hypothetical protein
VALARAADLMHTRSATFEPLYMFAHFSCTQHHSLLRPRCRSSTLLHSTPLALKAALSKLDVSLAKAGNPSDLAMIMSAINATPNGIHEVHHLPDP